MYIYIRLLQCSLRKNVNKNTTTQSAYNVEFFFKFNRFAKKYKIALS